MNLKILISGVAQLTGSRKSLRWKLVTGGASIASIQILSRLLTLLLGIALARGLGVEGYGVYTYTLALLTFLMIFAELGMPTLVMREIATFHTQQNWPCLRGVLIWSGLIVFLASTILVIIAVIALWQFGGKILSPQRPTLLFALPLLPLAAFTKEITAIFRGLQHVVKAQAIETLIRPTLLLLGVCLLFTLKPDLRCPQYVMAIQVCVGLTVLCVATISLYCYLPKHVLRTKAQYKGGEWLASALPLTFIGGASIINNQTDILMLGIFKTTTDVGLYHVAVQGAVLVGFGLQVANAVIAPQFARLHSLGNIVQLQRLVTASGRVILLIAVPVAGTLFFLGDYIVGWIFGPEFTQSYTPLAILSAGQLANAAIGSVGFLLNMTGNEKDVARTLLITAGLNILLNLLLIPPFGMAGAASATSISLVVWNVILYRIVKDKIGINSMALC